MSPMLTSEDVRTDLTPAERLARAERELAAAEGRIAELDRLALGGKDVADELLRQVRLRDGLAHDVEALGRAARNVAEAERRRAGQLPEVEAAYEGALARVRSAIAELERIVPEALAAVLEYRDAVVAAGRARSALSKAGGQGRPIPVVDFGTVTGPTPLRELRDMLTNVGSVGATWA